MKCYLISIISVIYAAIHLTSAQTSPFLPISVNYDCDRRLAVDPGYLTCRSLAADYWIRYIDEGTRTKYTCCYNWDVFDCMERAIENVCGNTGSYSFSQFTSRKRELISFYESYQCYWYPYRSVKCYFPGWAIALIVVGGLILIAAVAGGVLFAMRRRRMRAK